MAQDSIEKQLADAEKRTGLPAGVLRSVLQQETGGKQEYLDDPAKYHYGLNAEGKRIAGHTGKVSTAFGPFGILESTGASPGYGVEPLKDKSLTEQIRFASDYLSARIKSAGSVEAGLAGYGEGTKYAKQVMGRAGMKMPELPVPAVAPRQNLPEAPQRDPGWPVLPTARLVAKSAAAPDLSVLMTGNAQVQALSDPAASQAQTQAAVAGDVDLQTQKDATGFGVVFDTARHDPRIQPMFTALDYLSKDKEVVPEGWTYAAIRDETEAGHTDEEREYLRENATGPEALQAAQAQIALRRDMDRTYGLAGGFTAFAGQMAGGAMDPVGFALGLGAGKALQSVGIGSRALANAGRTRAAAASFLGENALANVSVELMQDTMGEVKTSADYALAGVSGVALAAPFTRGAIRGKVDANVRALTDDMHTKAVQEQMGKVVAEAGEGMDAPAVAKAVQERELADIMATVKESQGPQRREQVVPEGLAQEQRKLFDGEELEPELPAALEAESAPHAVPEAVEVPYNPEDWGVQPRVERAVSGDVSNVLRSKDGDVLLNIHWRPDRRPAPGPHTFSIRDMMDAAFTNRPGSVSATARYFLSRLSDDVLSMPVKLTNARTGGSFRPSSASIEVGTKTADGTRRLPIDHVKDMSFYEQYVLLHEVGHAATQAKIEAHLQAPHKLAPELRQAMSQLDDLRNRYTEEVRKRYPNPKDGGAAMRAHYGTQNLHEFAAQMWSDPVQRDILRGMEGKPVAGKFSNAWKDFIQVLAKILGLTGKDALVEGTRLLDNIISADGSSIKYSGGEPTLNAMPSPPPQQVAAFARKFAAGMHQHARDFVQRNPINLNRLKTATAKIGGLSDGLVLASSQNPIMQMVAALVTETTTGAAGRKATVSIRYSMLDKVFMGNSLSEYTGAFEVWANSKGKGMGDKYIRGDAQREFGNAVYLETLNRRDANYSPNPDANIVRAADALEATFERARKAQVDAGTLGSNHLAASSRGHMPQALDGNKLQTLTTAELHGVHNLLSEQFQQRLGWDKAFADTFAPYYTDRVRKRAQGSQGIDASGAGGNSGQIIRDTLEEMALDPNSRNRDEARQAATGLGHTKRRLDLDLRDEYAPGKRLMDVYVTDPLTLTRMYSRRTAGTVALTESGIHGVQGVRQLRDAAGTSVDGSAMPSAAEFDAFDRVMSEILGTPVAGRVASAGATNLALMVNLQRMGGLVFTQAVETFQLIHAVGLRSTLAGISDLPRILGDVGRIKKGQAPSSHILASIEAYGGEIGMENYKMVAPLDPPDALVGQYMEQSGLLSRLLRAGGHMQSKISGFRGLMAAQHRMAAEQVVMKAARYIRDGLEDVALNDMGFTKEVRDSLKGDLNKVAQWDTNGNLVAFDLTQVSDPHTAEAFVQAVHRGVGQIIQGTFVGERNKWFHNDYLKLMLQLRTFGLTAVEKQWGRQVQNNGGGLKGYTYAAGMLASQMALALPIHAARVQLASAGREDRDKFIEDNMNPAALARATMNYASMSGLTGDMLDIVTAVGGGWADEGTKEMIGARQQAMGVGRIVPVAGSIDQAFKVASGQADLHTALKQLPFSNLWYLLPAINLTKGD